MSAVVRSRKSAPSSKLTAVQRADAHAKKVQAQAKTDHLFAQAYNVFHVCRVRMWEALAVLVASGRWIATFETEDADSASGRSENTAFWGGFRFQPERKPSGKVAGVRNLGDYPAELRERTSGWCAVLSPEARALADRAHGYLEYVRLSPASGGDPTPILTARNGAPHFSGLWAGRAPRPDVLALPKLAPGNNADLTGRIYARMDQWRAQVARVRPDAIPAAGATTDYLDLVRSEVHMDDGEGGEIEACELHPLRCYLAARTVFWAQVARLETLYLGRLLGRGKEGPLTQNTQPDKHGDAVSLYAGGEDVVSREDFAQELTPYTYRAMESWHPARGHFSTYYEFKVKHALRNLRARHIPRCDTFAQEQDYMSGACDPYQQASAGWRRGLDHTDAPAGVGEALIRGLTTQPDGPDYVYLRELAAGAQPDSADESSTAYYRNANGTLRREVLSNKLRSAQAKAAAEVLPDYLGDQAAGASSARSGVVVRRRVVGSKEIAP